MLGFGKYEDTLPVPFPELPPTPQGDSENDRVLLTEQIGQWESDHKNVSVENDARFEKALNRIHLCAFLHGFLNVFGNNRDIVNQHYSWCPAEEWTSTN